MLIVDTGVLVAATDRTDPHHDACADLLTREPEQLATTAMVIAETAYLLDRELGPAVEATLYDSITGFAARRAISRPKWSHRNDRSPQLTTSLNAAIEQATAKCAHCACG